MIIVGTMLFGGTVCKITRTGVVVNCKGKMMEYSQKDVELAFDTGNYSN